MKTTEQKRAQAQRIVNLIDTRGDWVNRLDRFTQYLLKQVISYQSWEKNNPSIVQERLSKKVG